MSITPELRTGRLHLSCDTPGCRLAGPTMFATEDELLDVAESNGWNIEREFGLHYCWLHTIHDCAVCDAPTRDAVTDVSTGITTYYCYQHYPFRAH